MTEKKAPVIVGPPIDEASDPVLSKYKAGVTARAEQRRADRPKLGNLVQGDEQYKPGKDRPMTIAEIGDAQKAVEREAGRTGLSPATVAGMEAIAAATKAARGGKETTVEEPKPEQPAAPPAAAPQPAVEAKKPDNAATKAAIQDMDDFELERIMRGIQQDAINNETERAHVNDPKNGRVSEIDFMEGVSAGEFTQFVTIVKDKLRVKFRTVTALENQAIRLWIFNRAAADPRIDRIAGEIFSVALTVCSIAQINLTSQPKHLSGTMNDLKFDEETFVKKYQMFVAMPSPLIHALGVHATWFDQRVREMFTADFVKNG